MNPGDPVQVRIPGRPATRATVVQFGGWAYGCFTTVADAETGEHYRTQSLNLRRRLA